MLHEADLHHGSHTLTFTKKNWIEHLREYVRYLPAEFAAFIAAVVSIWGIAEVLTEVADTTIRLKDLAIPAVSVAIVIVLYKAWIRYKAHVPEALTDESQAAQSIFWKQRSGWQFALAEQLITDRIRDDQEALARMQSGAEYVRPRKVSLDEYMAWLSNRPESVSRLVHAVAVQCTTELPSTLASAKSEADVDEVKRRCLRLAALYGQARRLEQESYEILPPDALEQLHEKTFGWTEPVREGVARFLEIANQLATMTLKQIQDSKSDPPVFDIPFDPPEVLNEYSILLDRIDLSNIGV